ncbi:MAG: SDR family oxidoreductase [Chloroflexi bacterium]|nr:SDR family oxidoreductase [Chloroflexota bacterium]
MADKQGFFTAKVALITGGSSGIGLALAKQLAAQGARVWIAGRRKDVLAAAGTEVQSAAGRTCGLLPADVADASQAARMVAEVTRRDGLHDLVINSAGVTQPGYVQELGLDVFRQMMEINYFGTVNVVKAVLPGMLERGSGHIVNISSGAGFLGVFGYSAYGASKYAVRGFSDVLRAEMKPHGIRVSVAFPPDTDTPQLAYETPFKPPETKAISGNASVRSPEFVAAAILKGVRRGRYVILPGADTWLFYHLSNLLGNGVYPIMDMMVASARRKKS